MNPLACIECFFYILEIVCTLCCGLTVQVIHLLNIELQYFRSVSNIRNSIQTMHIRPRLSGDADKPGNDTGSARLLL